MDCPALWPCLKQIDTYLDTKNEAVTWFKTLQQSGLETLIQATEIPSEDWVNLGTTQTRIPLRVLIELRALRRAYESSLSFKQQKIE